MGPGCKFPDVRKVSIKSQDTAFLILRMLKDDVIWL